MECNLLLHFKAVPGVIFVASGVHKRPALHIPNLSQFKKLDCQIIGPSERSPALIGSGRILRSRMPVLGESECWTGLSWGVLSGA
jgi:hypothetical protein